MVSGGLAVVLDNGIAEYNGAEKQAAALGAGIWGSGFQTPADYRGANPARFARSKPRNSIPVERVVRPSGAPVYYRNYAEARAAGAVPIYRGQPGYRIGMDGDGDGIACEPYRRRR